ncbi:MAG: hypothetical protein CMK43_02350 [Porticoccaceae bacterium]|nr:hypothetical protein [Porticoccaceae bacterium]
MSLVSTKANLAAVMPLTWIKLVVYSLLLFNFVFYVRDDWIIAGHTLHSGSTFLQWASAYNTTIDESAWLLLLLLFEMETHLLAGRDLSRAHEIISLIIRLCCYVVLAHTPYAYAMTVYDLSQAPIIEGVTDLCQLADQNLSYAYNLVYTKITDGNCSELSTASQFFFNDPPDHLIVQDEMALALERRSALVDLVESITWLLILLSIEVVVWLQDKDITGGLLIKSANMAKVLLYSLLWFAIGYWIYLGHYMFAWDEFVWIVGFVAIEMNVVERRKDVKEPV